MKKRKILIAILLITVMLSGGCGNKTKIVVETGDTNTGDVVTGDTTADTGLEDTDVTDIQIPSTSDDHEQTENQNSPTKENGTPVEMYGELSVDGANLIDQNGDPVQLRGVSTSGIAWFPQFCNQEAFETMYEEWGIQIVRITMYTDENGGYCVGTDRERENLKAKVKECVDAATELGLYVIIDWHVLRDCNPTKYQDQAVLFFDEMAELYKDNVNVLYEICNEPNGDASWSDIKSYASAVIPVIKAHNDDAVVIVGTPTWSQDVDQAAKDPITGYTNIMYALHFYADTHRDSLRQKMEKAIKAGLPIFVTEYGICDASGNGSINEEEAAKWVTLMNQYQVSYIQWCLSNKDETSSMLSSSTTATAGWTLDQLSDSGKWFVEMMKGNLDSVGTSGITGDTFVQEEDGYVPPSGDSSNVTVEDLFIDATTTNTWHTDTDNYYQYGITLKNQKSETLKGWKIVITFSGDIQVDQCWCCETAAAGNQLTITPASWNTNIKSGESISDMGVIIYAGTTVSITEINIQ